VQFPEIAHGTRSEIHRGMRKGNSLKKTLLLFTLAAASIPLLLAGCGDDSGGKLDLSVIDAKAPTPDLEKAADLSQTNGDLGDQD
jgi:hypothetical protein